MSDYEYRRKTWVDGEVIYEEDLNRMETGIVEALREASLSTSNAEKAQTAASEAKDAVANIGDHSNKKDNPHEVTKSQVGLGNVPNVATNDQTPTHKQASTLATLTSGEKLSVAFGKIAKAIADLISHLANKENPHGVTAAQVGLGNVPNVATNDQTPTHTQASTLAKLTSGEKLSVAFGKIAKAIADLIAHIGNKENPHEVTKSQVGLGNVPNVATDDQTPTHTQASTLAKLTSGEKLSVAFGKIAKAIADLISHLANKENPHGVTAAQVGAPQMASGTYSGTASSAETAAAAGMFSSVSDLQSGGKKITLPFVPEMILVSESNGQITSATSGTGNYVKPPYLLRNGMSAYHNHYESSGGAVSGYIAYLSGSTLYVGNTGRNANSYSPSDGLNVSGKTYQWTAFG